MVETEIERARVYNGRCASFREMLFDHNLSYFFVNLKPNRTQPDGVLHFAVRNEPDISGDAHRTQPGRTTNPNVCNYSGIY